MNINYKNQIIEKVANETIANKLEWKILAQNHQFLVNKILAPSEIVRINQQQSYWCKDTQRLLLLLSMTPQDYLIIIHELATDQSASLVIPTETYFRLKTLIQNNLNLQGRIFDDFLNS